MKDRSDGYEYLSHHENENVAIVTPPSVIKNRLSNQAAKQAAAGKQSKHHPSQDLLSGQKQ